MVVSPAVFFMCVFFFKNVLVFVFDCCGVCCMFCWFCLFVGLGFVLCGIVVFCLLLFGCFWFVGLPFVCCFFCMCSDLSVFRLLLFLCVACVIVCLCVLFCLPVLCMIA